MQLSQETLEILKNYSTLNSGIFINKGNLLQTVEKASRSMAAYAVVKEEFPQDFGIYDVPKLLSIFSMSKTFPEIEFDENHMVITNLGGRSRIKYRFCSEEMLVVVPKRLTLPTEDIQFTLEEDDYDWIVKAAKILETPTVAVVCDGTKVVLTTYDSRNDAIPDQSLDLVTNGTSTKYKMVLDFDKFNKMIPGTYAVVISDHGMARFKASDRELEYFIALNEESEYDI